MTAGLRLRRREQGEVSEFELPQKRARLTWLNSRRAHDDSELLRRIPPLAHDGPRSVCAGSPRRCMRVGDSGLPEAISVGDKGVSVLSTRVRFEVRCGGDEATASSAPAELKWGAGSDTHGGGSSQTHAWRSVATVSGCSCWGGPEGSLAPLILTLTGELQHDGHSEFGVTATSLAGCDVSVASFVLSFALPRGTAQLSMGMGKEGGRGDRSWSWRWADQVGAGSHMLWLGSADAGLRLKLLGNEEGWGSPRFVITSNRVMPRSSWAGLAAKGGCTVSSGDEEVRVVCESGAQVVRGAAPSTFKFDLMMTPMAVPDMAAHWARRGVQVGYQNSWFAPERDPVFESNPSFVNMHQGTPANPFINYPLDFVGTIGDWARAARARRALLKIYFTTRELSTVCPELFALHSMDDVLLDGSRDRRDNLIDDERNPNGDHGKLGYSWLQERLVTKYSTAWANTIGGGRGRVDTAVHVSGTSRWNNFYVEGVHSLSANQPHIGGLYLDGVAFDRRTMRRTRAVLDRGCRLGRRKCEIDFHSGNTLAGVNRRVSAILAIMQHLPYIDSLWLGEGYHYGHGPDYWLAEVSGIPFGLMGETMNAPTELGLVYGMATRVTGKSTAIGASRVYRIWDAFGMTNATMVGYWEEACPVELEPVSPGATLRATAYVRGGLALIAVGDFTGSTSAFHLRARAGFWGWSGAALLSLTGQTESHMLREYATPPLQPSRMLRGQRSGSRYGSLLLLGRDHAEVAALLQRVKEVNGPARTGW